MRKRHLLFLSLLLSACRPVEVTHNLVASPTVASTQVPSTITLTPQENSTHTPSPTNTAETTPQQIATTGTSSYLHVCGPLEGETFESLQTIIFNPLDIPPFGHDDGHHGVDFLYFNRGNRDSIEGVEIYAILSGTTILSLDDNFPYGYTIMIETPLSILPESVQDNLMTGYLPVPETVNYQANCPDIIPPTLSGDYSIYHLYAHLENPPAFEANDPIACGEPLGRVGNSGRSSNPHLHLETRLGPSGADFEEMAHYENTATIKQMQNYCLWRMSGYYQLFDPFILFTTDE